MNAARRRSLTLKGITMFNEVKTVVSHCHRRALVGGGFVSNSINLLTVVLVMTLVASCGRSQVELESKVKYHDALFPGIGDAATLRVSNLSLNSDGVSEIICGTAFYDLSGGHRQSPSRFLLYISPIKFVIMENDSLRGRMESFGKHWSENCKG